MRFNDRVMTDAPERFATWVSTDIAPFLRADRFTKSGLNFHKRGQEGWGVVNFQKSPWGSRAETQFTINLGVALDVLAPVFGRDPAKKPPDSMCHWSERIGLLLDAPRDTWWGVKDGTDLQALTAEILPLLRDRALPAIEERMTAEGFLRRMRSDDRASLMPSGLRRKMPELPDAGGVNT